MDRRSKYGEAGKLNPYHLDCFKGMLVRVSTHGLSCDFTPDASSFLEFVEFIGPVPDGMKTPTVGRKNHNEGYVFGNFEWQSKADNSRESARRNHSGVRESEQTCQNISAGQLNIAPGVRSRMSAEASKRLTGKPLPEDVKEKIRQSTRTPEFRSLMSSIRSSVPFSDDHRRKLSEAAKLRVKRNGGKVIK